MRYPTPRAALLAMFTLAASAALVLPANAATSERIRTACTSDYLRFCSQFDPESFQTANCMKRVGKRLSQVCRTAVLEEGGQSSRRVTTRQR
jgi:hypothetical protein